MDLKGVKFVVEFSALMFTALSCGINVLQNVLMFYRVHVLDESMDHRR